MSVRNVVTASMLLAFGAGSMTAQAAGAMPGGQDLRQTQQLVASLHADKPGQARVFAADGREFTAGQAQWMRAQLRLADLARASGRDEEAARRLADVERLIQAHRPS